VKDQRNAHFVEDLREGSALLNNAYRQFLRGFALKDCQITSFYEMRDTQVVVVCFHAPPSISCASADFDMLEARDDGCWERNGPMVRMVTSDSATWALPTEAIHMQIPIDADHFTMVKFSDSYDPHYIAVRGRLYECVKRAPGIIENRLARSASVEECMWFYDV
jgi:hypothetical protein